MSLGHRVINTQNERPSSGLLLERRTNLVSERRNHTTAVASIGVISWRSGNSPGELTSTPPLFQCYRRGDRPGAESVCSWLAGVKPLARG